MRIGIDCRKIFDFGIGTYVRGLATALAVLEGDEEYVLFAPVAALDLLPKNCERVAVDAGNYTIRELWVMARAIERARLDAFHSPHFVLPWTDCPSVATLHDAILFHYPPRNPVGFVYVAAMTARAARISRELLTVSEAARVELAGFLDCDPRKITVTPNGIDDVFVVPGEPARRERPYLLCAGNDKPHKNVDRLVEAFREAKLNVDLVLTGAPFERFRGVDGVACVGFVTAEELAALHRGAVAVVVPSLEEGFGLTAAEAMAVGAPVLTSNTPALVEVTGDAALHVDARDVDALAAGLRRVVTGEALRRELSARGRERARLFTWRRCAELTREVYRRVGASP